MEKGLRNYWGYNTLGFFAPHQEYSSAADAEDKIGQQVQEFKQMVRSMHAAGIEVILDVVYNHTAEGNHLGPTLSFKGIDNPSYYRLMEDDARYYMDYTGTGNSLNVRQPHSLQLIMDSLRYWVTEMHVDGFRFDLAATLAREFYDVDRLSSFFELVQQDPVVSQVKLIAEPWDIGPGGYQVGNFPPQWTEWNGAYRDTVRDFWRGEPSLGEFASRLAGSADYYEHSGRRPVASINFVTAHDGFTLRDLVSYNEKRNDANGEGNNDGESHNRSWNHGAEGPTDDPAIQADRAKAQRNFLATLLLSQGVPMILHGDEMGRSQDGNNNTYAQDSEIAWMHWDTVDKPLVEFTAAVAKLRHLHPTFRRKRFFTGNTVRTGDGKRLNDIVWLHLDGRAMEQDDWTSGSQAIGHVPQRRRHRRQGRPRPHHHRRPLPPLLQRRRTRAGDPATGGVREGVGRRHRHERRRPTARPRWRPGRRSSSTPAPSSSSRSTRSPESEPDHSVAASVAALAQTSTSTPAADQRSGVPAHQVIPTTDRMRTPRSTYRLQVTPDFDLHAAGRVLPYLHDLGVDWVYLSPVLQATAGSSPRVRRGRPVPRRRLARRVLTGSRPCRPRPAGSAWACSSTSCPTTWAWPIPTQNPWWWDLLSLGRGSAYADAFDVDWDAFGDRVMVPVLGDGGERPATAYPEPAEHYELVSWRRGDSELNYRRFFTITTLAGVRVEEPVGVRRVAPPRSGAGSTRASSTGCGSTTPTACRDPAAYLDDLARLTGRRIRPGREDPRAGRAPRRPRGRRPARPGTTPSACIDRVLVDPAGQAPLDALEARLRGGPVSWADSDARHQARRGRRVVAGRGTADRREARPSTPDAVAEVLACFPVYRSYLPQGVEHLDQALAAAREHRPDLGGCVRRAGAGAVGLRAIRRRCGSSRRAGW